MIHCDDLLYSTWQGRKALLSKTRSVINLSQESMKLCYFDRLVKNDKKNYCRENIFGAAHIYATKLNLSTVYLMYRK